MTWGPDSARAAVSVTFDNLGEAEERIRGAWPADEPLGNHPSVRAALPRILSLLDELGLRATFFAEGVNTEVYPDALASIAERSARPRTTASRHARASVSCSSRSSAGVAPPSCGRRPSRPGC